MSKFHYKPVIGLPDEDYFAVMYGEEQEVCITPHEDDARLVTTALNHYADELEMRKQIKPIFEAAAAEKMQEGRE